MLSLFMVVEQIQRYDKSKVCIYYCEKYGHFANQCRKKQTYASKQLANLVEKSKENENPFLLNCNVAQGSSKNVYFVDNGCRNHMIGNVEWFTRLDNSLGSQVNMGNDNKVIMNRNVDISIYDRNHQWMLVDDAYYVPSLKCNFVSVGHLVDRY